MIDSDLKDVSKWLMQMFLESCSIFRSSNDFDFTLVLVIWFNGKDTLKTVSMNLSLDSDGFWALSLAYIAS